MITVECKFLNHISRECILFSAYVDTKGRKVSWKTNEALIRENCKDVTVWTSIKDQVLKYASDRLFYGASTIPTDYKLTKIKTRSETAHVNISYDADPLMYRCKNNHIVHIKYVKGSTPDWRMMFDYKLIDEYAVFDWKDDVITMTQTGGGDEHRARKYRAKYMALKKS